MNVSTGQVDLNYDGRSTIIDASADLEYLLLSDPVTLFRLDGNQLTALRDIPLATSFAFHPNNQHYIITGSGSIDIYDLSTNALVSSIATPEEGRGPIVDLTTNFIGVYPNRSPSELGDYRVYDVSTGELKLELPLVNPQNDPGEIAYFLLYNKVFNKY